MGYVITVNDEKVWESEGEAYLVDEVEVIKASGSAATIRTDNLDTWLNIKVNVRDAETSTYLDIQEQKRAQERRELLENEPAPVEETETQPESEPEEEETAPEEEASPEEDEEITDLSEF